MRYAAKVDENQSEIVDALRQAGISVWIIKQPVDLLFHHCGRFGLIEVKKPSFKRARKDQERQSAFLATYAVPVVRTAEEALAAVLSRCNTTRSGERKA